MGVTYSSTVPSMIDADAIRALRLNGSPPCAGGLAEALRWIGSRRIPIAEAIKEARGSIAPANLDWAFSALGIFGYGSGSGYGYGYGDVYGDGYGSGSGYCDGSGYGDGCGDIADVKEVGDETAR